MSGYNQVKGNNVKVFGASNEDYENGTAARTRPLSYEEIMMRRKAKKISDEERSESVALKVKCGTLGKGDHLNEPGRHDEVVSDPYSTLKYRMPERLKSKVDLPFTSDARNVNSRSGPKEVKEMISLVSERGNRTADYRKKNYAPGIIDDRNGHASTNSRVVSHKSRDIDVSRGKAGREDRQKSRDDSDKNRNDVIKEKRKLVGNRSGIPGKSDKKKSYHGDVLPKRKQSRSPEHEDKGRMPMSQSLTSHKQTVPDGKRWLESSPQMLQDRKSKRDWSDPSRSRTTKHGSGSEFRKHSVSTSGLGGYSPRKRRTITVAKTSPVKQSLEKRRAKWDLAPEGASIASDLLGSNINLFSDSRVSSSSIYEVVNSINVPSSANPLPFFPTSVLPIMKSISLDSIQLTQATRPLRRLYLENLPSTVTEKDLMEWLNNLMISSGVNLVQGTEPCISCAVHKDKGQAVVELLTPEDASAALHFSGTSLSGSIINFRRPKDFVEVATGEVEKSAAAPSVAVSDIVIDSPNKIFVGGIPKILSSEMFMEIAIAFGSLKAFQFEKSEEYDKQYAFLEYVDQSVTLKACAGLSGMKLGGQTITAVKTASALSPLGHAAQLSGCTIPEHARPLLQSPMCVLLLRNVLLPEALTSLASSEVDEILEDVRLECARFGMVKKVSVLKRAVHKDTLCSHVLPPIAEGSDVNLDWIHIDPDHDGAETTATAGGPGAIDSRPEYVACDGEEKQTDHVNADDAGAQGKNEAMESEHGPIYEAGCVFVEFGRVEAACMAAHCLHGRSFDDRIVTVAYVCPDTYRACFR